MKSLNKGLAAIVAVLAGSLGCAKGVAPHSPPPKPHSNKAFGLYFGLPELIALRYVAGVDKPCSLQANIGPIFGSIDVRMNKKKFGSDVTGYGLVGMTALMPWVKDLVVEEIESPTYCPEFGVGFEKGKKDGLTVGAEFALVIPLEEKEEADTMGFRFGVSVVKRY